ncbi:Myotrophin [Bienertia sinuspersici]
MKRLLKQRKAGEISLTDEEIYAKIKPKGKHNNRNRRTGVSPLITSLFGGFSKCEKFEKKSTRQRMKLLKLRRKRLMLMSKTKFSQRS